MIRLNVTFEDLRKLLRVLREHPRVTIIVLVLAGVLGWVVVVRTGLWSRPPGRGSSELEVTIQVPEQGAIVNTEELIRGSGASTASFYYPVVTSLQTGAAFIAGPRIGVHSDGAWEGLARFGDAGTAPRTRFHLQILQSKVQLPEGALRETTTSFRRSKAVEVERR